MPRDGGIATGDRIKSWRGVEREIVRWRVKGLVLGFRHRTTLQRSERQKQWLPSSKAQAQPIQGPHGEDRSRCDW